MLYYESMTVYQKAFSANKQVYRFLKTNRSIPSYMKNQLGRATLSIMLNIAEGTAKNSPKERGNFYKISRGSTFEVASIVKFLESEKEIDTEKAIALYASLEEISKMLFAMIKNQSSKSR